MLLVLNVPGLIYFGGIDGDVVRMEEEVVIIMSYGGLQLVLLDQ